MSQVSKVSILSPVPPPCGGIGNWTLLMRVQGDKEIPDRVRYFDTNINRKNRMSGSFFSLLMESFFSLVFQFVRLFFEIARRDVFVIHSCSSGGLSFFRDAYALCLSRAFGKRFVLHLHFGRISDVVKAKNIEGRLFRFLVMFSHALIVLDLRSYESLRTAFSGKEIALIPNSTNVPLDVPCGDRSNSVVFAGWVVKTKGVEELLGAWGEIGRGDWRLTLIGPYEAEYMEALKRKFDFCNVDILGEISNSELISRFRTAKIMCLPSYTEGFPFVVIEAMASGCAIVATPVGAIPEVLENDSGVLVPVADVEGLRAALTCLMNNQDRVRALSASAVSAVRDKYQLSKVYAQYRKVWGI